MTLIKRRAYVLLLITLTMVGALLAGSVTDASASHGGRHNSVENGAFSNANMMVCAPGGLSQCLTLLPGQKVFETDTWNPVVAYVGAYQKSIYRVVKDDYMSGWVARDGGTAGSSIDLAALQAMWGRGVLVQVILDDPR